MPYDVNFEDKGAYVRFEGHCSYRDVLNATIQIWENPDFEYIRYELFDYLAVTELVVDDQHVVEMAVRDRVATRSTRRDKIAVVATSEPILEMAAAYQTVIEKSDIQFFVTDSVEKARAWIEAA